MTWKVKVVILLLVVLSVAFVIEGMVLYADSYSTSTRIGEWKRLPLSYPWHLVDYGNDSSGVQLEDWRVYVGELEATKTGPVPIRAGEEQETLQTLKYIGRFGFRNGYIYGVRDIYSPPNSKDVLSPKWFIFKCGDEMPCYYDTKDEYTAKCRALFLDEEKINSFSEEWERFHGKVSQRSAWMQVLSGWAALFEKGSKTHSK